MVDNSKFSARVTTSANQAMLYNGEDERVRVVTTPATGAVDTRLYIYDTDHRIIGEYGAGGTADIKAEYIWLSAELGAAGPAGGDDGLGGWMPLATAVGQSGATTRLGQCMQSSCTDAGRCQQDDQRAFCRLLNPTPPRHPRCSPLVRAQIRSWGRSYMTHGLRGALLGAVAALALATAPAFAQDARDLTIAQLSVPDADYFWPGADLDPAVPSPRSVLGFGVGERMATHAELSRYFEALAASAPDRVKLFDYGQSWQGKRLFYAVIGAPEKIARLDTIKADAQRLSDPRRLAPGEAEAIIARHPAITWLAYAVHGDEPGPSDAAVQLAWHLVASRGDARMADIRANGLVVIVPVQNPDGRDRFIATNTGARGVEPDADPLSAERDQPWPGGRVNHAIMDLNRDWFAQTQPETQHHARAMLDWFPAVVVDSHEMGTDSTFFFPPEAEPKNPHVPAEQLALRELIGRNTGAWFDRFGINYFTREIFDLFYPGYGDGWPSTQGAISMTYEQGSARGLRARRSDGTLLTYPETVRSQFVASLSAIEVASKNRDRFVRAFASFRRTAVEEGRREPVRAYVIPAQADQAGADKLAALLVRQGVEVGRARAGFSACGKSYGAGSLIVSAAQPSKRLIRNLLDKEVPLDPRFIQVQEERRKKGLDDQIYDVTAWSLPLLYNVAVDTCAAEPGVATDAVTRDFVRPGTVDNPEASVGFIIAPGSSASARIAAQGLRSGLTLRSMQEAFTLDGRQWPAGSLVALRAENPDSLAASLQALARSTGARVTGVNTSWVTDGPNFGSASAVKLRNPRIALAWDSPVDRYSAGATRFVVERKLGLPVTPVRVRRLAGANLQGFDVVIVPDSEGDYASVFGESGARNLRTFARNGGVVIAIGNATRWMAEPNVDLIAARRENAIVDEASRKASPATPRSGESTIDGSAITNSDALAAATAAQGGPPKELDGAIVALQTDPDSWLTAGLAPRLHALIQGSDIYRPLTRDEGVNAVSFAGPDELVASGIVWDDNRKQLAFKPYTMVQQTGRGFIVAFTGDPTYRGFSDGLDGLFLNAILQTTARARPSR